MKREELLLKSMFPTVRLTPRYRRTSLLLSRSERPNHAGLQPVQLFLRPNCGPRRDGDRFKIASVSGLTDAALLLENKTAVPFENGDQLLQFWQNFGRTIAWKTREETRASLSQLLRHHGIMHIVSSSPLCAVVFDVCAQCCCFGVALVELPCLVLKALTAQLSIEPSPTNHAGKRCREKRRKRRRTARERE